MLGTATQAIAEGKGAPMQSSLFIALISCVAVDGA